jgi:hypothetical protein
LLFETLGFRLKIVTSLTEFLQKLPKAHEAWIISGRVDAQDWLDVSEPEFIKAVLDFHQSGRGLALWASGDPWFAEANAILKELFQIQLTGKLVPEANDQQAQLPIAKDASFLGSGCSTIYQGVASYPQMNDIGSFVSLVTQTNPAGGSKSLAFYKAHSQNWPPSGRVFVDTGFTKLLQVTDATRNYACNIAVWLLSLDVRIPKNAPLTGTLLPPGVQVSFLEVILSMVNFQLTQFYFCVLNSIFGNTFMVVGITMIKLVLILLKRLIKNIWPILVNVMFDLCTADIGIIWWTLSICAKLMFNIMLTLVALFAESLFHKVFFSSFIKINLQIIKLLKIVFGFLLMGKHLRRMLVLTKSLRHVL